MNSMEGCVVTGDKFELNGAYDLIRFPSFQRPHITKNENVFFCLNALQCSPGSHYPSDLEDYIINEEVGH
jgi:hypothetical protein